MMQRIASLTQQQHAVIDALAGGANLNDAAVAAGVNRTTIFRWRQDPEFQRELIRRRTSRSGAQLRGLADLAVGTLAEVMRSADVPADVRVRAALGVLELAGEPAPRRDVSPRPASSGGAVAELSEVSGLLEPIDLAEFQMEPEVDLDSIGVRSK